MDYKEINAQHTDHVERRSALISERERFAVEYESIRSRLETIDALIAAEDAVITTLAQHMPQDTMPKVVEPYSNMQFQDQASSPHARTY
jgi:hypothetical protein